MKTLIRIAVVLLVSIPVSYFPLSCSQEFYSVIYTVLGIMFSIALSQLMSFSFTEVSNPGYVQMHRSQLKKIRNRFIEQFSGATIFFLFSDFQLSFKFGFLRFNFNALVFTYLIFCLIYFIWNFIDLSNLKDSIEDQIRESKFKTD